MSIVGAFIVPHPPMSLKEIGRGSERQIEKTINSYEQIAQEISKIEPETIIISTPHTEIYNDYFNILSEEKLTGNFKRFGAEEVSFEEDNDIELVNKIEEICNKSLFPAGTLGEKNIKLDHGTMVPLYFIRKYYTNFKLVVIGLSNLPYPDHYKIGQIINKAVEDLNRKVVYIASGDLSHKLQDYGPYGFIEEGPIYEKQIVDICKNADFIRLLTIDKNICNKAAECGHRSFIMMAGALDRKDVDTTFYSHEDITGVGYQILSYYPKNINENRNFLDKYLKEEKRRLNDYYNNADEYIMLAKNTIDEYVTNYKEYNIQNVTNNELLNNKAGVFVSIHKFNNLRGCIGTIMPTCDNIAEEIIINAISAATKDIRFLPITKDELEYLEIKVDVLTKPEKIDSIDELDCKKYGIIVKSGFKRGVLLPDLDNVETVDEQIKIAKNKAMIEDDEDFTIEKFEVIRHKAK